MSNMGNMGNLGDMGNMGDNGNLVGGGALLPDRIDLPFVTEVATEVWTWDGTNWSESTTPVTLNTIRVDIAQWADQDWGANWAAWLVLAEFAQTGWMTSIDLTSVLWDPAKQESELSALISLAEDERGDALGEILAQNASYEDFMAYFVALTKISPRTHPKTFQLLHVAGLVGILVTMYFKRNPGGGRPPRARPSQICPALAPPVAVPGHPSFPSGHATQSMLMALCMGQAAKDTVDQGGYPGVWDAPLQGLSRRIARNREIAGLHFASDSTAGFELARQTFRQLARVAAFQTLLDDASREWPAP
jgi:hypothetical protein